MGPNKPTQCPNGRFAVFGFAGGFGVFYWWIDLDIGKSLSDKNP
jgi:hypothetical protein